MPRILRMSKRRGKRQQAEKCKAKSERVRGERGERDVSSFHSLSNRSEKAREQTERGESKLFLDEVSSQALSGISESQQRI